MSRLKKSSYAAALAVTLIGSFEGLRTTAYPDVIGVPTICYGETKGVHLGDHKTKAQCDAMFVKRLDEFANHVEACVKKPMSDKTEVAFVSLAYNIGYGGFCKSSVVRNYNAGKYTEACTAMNAYDRAGSRVLRALVTRRSAESRLCLEGIQ
jgi:lysozyme